MINKTFKILYKQLNFFIICNSTTKNIFKLMTGFFKLQIYLLKVLHLISKHQDKMIKLL